VQLQLAIVVLLHDRPERNIFPIALAVREVRQVGQVNPRSLEPVGGGRHPDVATHGGSVDDGFPVVVLGEGDQRVGHVVDVLELLGQVEREGDLVIVDQGGDEGVLSTVVCSIRSSYFNTII